MIQTLASLWYILLLTPAIFWFFLISNFNKKYKSKFPALLYSIIYLIPLIGHAFLSWSFVKDLEEVQQDSKKILPIKTYLLYLVLPYLFMLCGPHLVIIVIILLTLVEIPLIGSLVFLTPLVPLVSFIWIACGFWKLNKIISESK